jgi:hypothetical protein
MKLFLARVVHCPKAVLPFIAAAVLIAGCIPSAPAPEAKPSPEAAQAVPAVPAVPAAPAKPSVTNEVLPPDSDGNQRSSLKIDTTSAPNVSVTVDRMKDGPGFTVHGTFNLSGTIVPTGPGKWKFSGQFSMAEPDFAVGAPEVSSMGTFNPNNTGPAMTTDASLMMIAIPVSPPAGRAPEGSTPRVIPVSLEMDAPESAQFTVTLTQK